jgi:ankyrin repeat protein
VSAVLDREDFPSVPVDNNPTRARHLCHQPIELFILPEQHAHAVWTVSEQASPAFVNQASAADRAREHKMGRMATRRLRLSLLLAAALQLRVADTFLAPAVLRRSPVGCTARPLRPSGRGALGVCMQDKLDELLQKLGAESFERNAGLTPLDLAIYSLQTRETTARLEALLSKGAAMARHPWNNQTALDAAAFQGRQDVVDMLLAHGAIPDGRHLSSTVLSLLSSYTKYTGALTFQNLCQAASAVG